MKRQISKTQNIVSNYLEQFFAVLLALLFIPVFLERLGKESFGLIGIYALVQSCIFVFDVGFRQTIGREFAKMNDEYSIREARNLFSSIEILVIFFCLLIFSLFFYFADFLALKWLSTNSFSVEYTATSITLIGAIGLVRFIECLYMAVLAAIQRQVVLNCIKILNLFMRYIGALFILEFVSNDILTYFYWQLAVAMLSIFMFGFAASSFMPKGFLRGKFSWSSLSNISRYAGGVTVASILGILIAQMDKIVLSSLISLENYSLYTLAFTLVGILISLATPVVITFFPQLTQAYELRDDCRFDNLFQLATQLIVCTIGPLAMVLAFFPKELIYVWTGDLQIAEDVTPVLRILAVANFLFAMSKINMQVMYSTGWTSFHAYFSIIGLLLIIPLNYLLIINFGALGAAYSWLIFCIFAFIFEYLFLFRILSSLNVSHWILGIVQPLLASVTVIVCMKLVLRDFIFYNILTGIGALVSVVLLACLAAIFAADVLRESLVLKINAVINGNTFKS